MIVTKTGDINLVDTDEENIMSCLYLSELDAVITFLSKVREMHKK